MKKYKNFTEYLQDEYYNMIFDSIKKFIKDNHRDINIYSYSVLHQDYLSLDDIHIKSCSFRQSQGNVIYFRATVEADVFLKGLGSKDIEADCKQVWFSLDFIGHLLSGLHMVQVINVDTYSKEKFIKENSLSKFLVPYLYSDQLENVATKFLEEYYPKALKTPTPINIDELLENMCLEKRLIRLRDNIFGMTFFKDSVVDVYDDFGSIIGTERVEEGTIVINPNVTFMRNIGSLNNTIIHECVHWDRHKNFFELQSLLDGTDITHIECEILEKPHKNQKDIETALSFMEWQANVLAPRILMPAEQTKKKFSESINGRLATDNNRISIIVEESITELADFFGVSKLAAKIRLIELGFVKAIGSFNYINGERVPAYNFNEQGFKKDQTFIIDRNNAIYESYFNPELSPLISSGVFIYINGFFCLNDEKYIEQDFFGRNQMTQYALDNVDECCLTFTIKSKHKSNFDDSYYRMCYLCRDIDSSAIIEATYDPNFKNNQNLEKRADEIRKTKEILNETLRINKEIGGLDFSETLKYHMTRKEITVEQLAERAELSDTSIKKYRNGSDKIQFPNVLALCIGLNLKPEYSRDLIEKAGYRLTNTEKHTVFKYLIDNHYDSNIDYWNQILGEFKIDCILPKN